MTDELSDKMLLSDCINDITDTIINTQIKLVDQYVKDYLTDFDEIEENGKIVYKPKKIIFKSFENTVEIPKSELNNNKNLSLKDFNVSGKFKVIPEGNKFMIDLSNKDGFDLDIDITFSKYDSKKKESDINNLINKFSINK
mgnify:CR=1 FL=1